MTFTPQQHRFPCLTMLSALLVVVGCGTDVDLGETGNTGGGGTAGAGGGEGGSGGSASGGGSSGPQIHIHFRSNTDTFAHSDALSGQTPIDHQSGLRKFQLLVDSSDPAPVTVFDFGQEFELVSYNAGDSTLVHSLAAEAIPENTYTLARVVHSHVQYRVASTMHTSGLNLPGEFNNLQVLSDGTLLEGQLFDHGYYEYVFSTGGMDFPTSGTNAPIPEWSENGGFNVVFENGEWAYYFPVLIPHSHDLNSDLDVVLEVNMFESFRWQDQTETDYADGVFDTTPTSFEPVLRFGANDFQVFLE